MTRPTIPDTYPPITWIVHPSEYEALLAAGEAHGFLPSSAVHVLDAYPLPEPSVLGGPYRPVLFPNVMRAAAAATCPPRPTEWQEAAWDAIGHKMHRGRDLPNAHPHYYVRETPDGAETIPVRSPDEWMRLLLEDVQTDIDAAAAQRAEAARLRAEGEERRRRQREEDEARTVRFIADLTAIGDALDAHDGGFTKAILDHHRPDPQSYGWTLTCAGCDQGCSCDAALWPCSTVELVAGRHGLDVPTGRLHLPRSPE